MKARIYRPTRNAMQSGQAETRRWKLVFTPQAGLYIDPLMGWSGMTDTTQQIQMYFKSEEEAIEYAKRNQLEYEIKEPELRIIKPKSYAANFSYKVS